MIFSVHMPAMRKKLIELTGLHCVDSGEDVGEVGDRIDFVTFARRYEREIYGHGFAAGIGADEEEIFSCDHKIFDRPLGRVVVYFKIGIAQKPVQCHPVSECVFDGFHEGMGRVQRTSELGQLAVQLFGEWLRSSASDSQYMCRRLAFDLPFDIVELAIYFNYVITQLEVLSPRVSAAANFGLGAVLEQCVEAGSSVGLNETREVFEEVVVALKREIGRKVKNNGRMFSIAPVDRHLAFTHGAFCFPILNFHRAVIGLNDLRSEHFSLESFIQEFESESTVLKPITQSRARECGIFPLGDFGLAILRQAVVTLFHDGGSKQAGTWQSSGDWLARFFSHDDVLLALRAGTHFLPVLKPLQAVQDLFQLVCDFVFDKDSLYLAGGTQQVVFRDLVWNRTSRDILRVYVLFVVALSRLLARLRAEFLYGRAGGGRLRIMAFCSGPVIFAIPFFLLGKKFVEFGL